MNFFRAALGGAPAEAVLVGALHLLFIYRFFIYRLRVAHASATARAADLQMFVPLREGDARAEQDVTGGRPTA
ncbi:MAG: hypothetical protein H0U94_12645 [Acidobacteria bacterium]|nr:hypothetical protein [Acidobacteriota bacterium]